MRVNVDAEWWAMIAIFVFVVVLMVAALCVFVSWTTGLLCDVIELLSNVLFAASGV